MFKFTIKKLVIFLLILISCWYLYNQITFKDRIFKFYIANPIPKSVEVVSGSYHWGFAVESICLSFKTDEETFNSFIEGYNVLTEKEIKWVRSMPLPKLPDNVIGYGKWKPDNTIVITLFWDKDTKTAYLRTMRGSIMSRK